MSRLLAEVAKDCGRCSSSDWIRTIQVTGLRRCTHWSPASHP